MLCQASPTASPFKLPFKCVAFKVSPFKPVQQMPEKFDRNGLYFYNTLVY
jgi:hypothetical protein